MSTTDWEQRAKDAEAALYCIEVHGYTREDADSMTCDCAETTTRVLAKLDEAIGRPASRDTGEEVCEVCGMPREDDIHDCGPYPLKGAHPYKPAQLSGDSGQSKPAPKAAVREDREGWLTEDEIVMGTEPLFDTPDSVTIGVTAKRLRALCRMALSALKGDTK